jgi:hypothetical protein
VGTLIPTRQVEVPELDKNGEKTESLAHANLDHLLFVSKAAEGQRLPGRQSCSVPELRHDADDRETDG